MEIVEIKHLSDLLSKKFEVIVIIGRDGIET